jgi:hypothetical protein
MGVRIIRTGRIESVFLLDGFDQAMLLACILLWLVMVLF